MSRTAKRIIARERAAKALAIAKSGATWDIVAQMSGYPHRSGAWRAVMKLLKEAEAPALEMRNMELARLDDMTMAVWPMVVRGNLAAIDRMLAIMNRRARLCGLDLQPAEQGPQLTQQDNTDRDTFLRFLQDVASDPQAFAAARRLQQITNEAIEVQAEVVESKPINGDGTNGGGP